MCHSFFKDVLSTDRMHINYNVEEDQKMMLWYIIKYSVIVWELPENRSAAQVGEVDEPCLNSCRTDQYR
jgi:hypothetical protein